VTRVETTNLAENKILVAFFVKIKKLTPQFLNFCEFMANNDGNELQVKLYFLKP
jgi:hypothetical protein